MKDEGRDGAIDKSRKAEGLLGLLVAMLCLTATREDTTVVKLLSIAISGVGLVCVFWLRRRLEKVWIEIYTITFLGIALVLLVNLLFLS